VPITTILFDAGGTLVFPNFRRVADEMAAHGLVADAAALAGADARVRFEIDRPDVIASTTDYGRFRRYFDALAVEAGLARLPDPVFQSLDDYHRVHNLWEDVPSDVPAALDRLRSAGVRMGVISNANGTVRAKLERVGLAGYFELIVDSHEEGIEKPDPRIFARTLERMGVRASEAAYVGDLYHVDVVGAAAAGLRPFLLDPFDLYESSPVPRIRSLAELPVS
jgi:HAD superfamily hydrolase (TIGR01509 family)